MKTPNSEAIRARTLNALADEVLAALSADNAVDVRVELALFKPGSAYTAIRANDAGTKIIYTDRAGNEVTCWAQDWTLDRGRRDATAKALRDRAIALAGNLRLTDEAILAAMAARPSGIHTYVIRNILASEHSFGRELETAAVRRRLIRMEAAGKVTSKRWGPGCSIEWTIAPTKEHR